MTMRRAGPGSQLERDSYVGWIAANLLWSRIETPTHRVCVPRTFVFPRPEIKDPPLLALPLGAEVEIVGERDKFLIEADGGFILSAASDAARGARRRFRRLSRRA